MVIGDQHQKALEEARAFARKLNTVILGDKEDKKEESKPADDQVFPTQTPEKHLKFHNSCLQMVFAPAADQNVSSGVE